METLDFKNLPTAAEVFAEMDSVMDAEARARWERTTLARAVANAVVSYRTAHRLSQGALAAKLGMKRPAVSRLELGEHNPSMETIERLVRELSLRFIVDIAPSGRDAAPLPPEVHVVGEATGANGTRVLIAAG